MDDINPYAPPEVGEIEAPVGRRWHVDGSGVMAKFGTVLPQVDLDSGVSEGELKCVPRVLQNLNAFGFLRTMLVVAAFLYLKSRFHLGPEAYVYLGLGLFAARRFGLLSGMSVPQQLVWTHVDVRREKRIRLRRWLRIAAMILVFVGIMTSLFLPAMASNFYGGDLFDRWLRWILPPGVLTILAIWLWAVFDRPKSRVSAAGPGWLRIHPVHPEALMFLRAREELRERPAAEGPTTRKRRIRTVYLHRYPLRVLFGTQVRNPLVMFQIALLKVFRSPLLVRDAWHFSEAQEVPFEEFCDPLREVVENWLGKHRDWSLVRSTRDTSPAGDLVTERAWLASPDFMHGIDISRAWMVQKPRGETMIRMVTWLADDKAFSTLDHPFAALADPELLQHATGDPEELFEAHLRGLGARVPDPPADRGGFLERIRIDSERTERLLTEQGYQSETRELFV